MGKKSRKKKEERKRGERFPYNRRLIDDEWIERGAVRLPNVNNHVNDSTYFISEANYLASLYQEEEPANETSYGYTRLRELVSEENIDSFMAIVENMKAYEHLAGYTKCTLPIVITKRYYYNLVLHYTTNRNRDLSLPNVAIRNDIGQAIRRHWGHVYKALGSFSKAKVQDVNMKLLEKDESRVVRQEVLLNNKQLLEEAIDNFNKKKVVHETQGYTKSGTFQNIRLIQSDNNGG